MKKLLSLLALSIFAIGFVFATEYAPTQTVLIKSTVNIKDFASYITRNGEDVANQTVTNNQDITAEDVTETFKILNTASLSADVNLKLNVNATRLTQTGVAVPHIVPSVTLAESAGYTFRPTGDFFKSLSAAIVNGNSIENGNLGTLSKDFTIAGGVASSESGEALTEFTVTYLQDTAAPSGDYESTLTVSYETN